MKKALPVFTLGVEEEYLIIDPETRDLRSHMSKIVDGAKIILQEQVKAEMHQSVVEVGTNICKSVKEAREEITFLRKKIVELAANQGLVVGAAGTHPFSKWQDQPITDDPRYHNIVNELQDAARSNLIFGMHCHVGIESREVGLQLINQACYFLPHIFALGDCAEVDGLVLPYVMPIMNAARALAPTLLGQPTAVNYPAMPVGVKTPALPVVVSPPAIGQTGQWIETETTDGVEALFKDEDGNLKGFALLGTATSQKAALTKLLPPLLA